MHVFVGLDQHSKYPLEKAMSKATSANVLKFPNETFAMFGTVESILSDNGSQFVSRQFQEFLASYSVRHVRTAHYAPQSSASERLNRSIISGIRAYIREDHPRWDEHLSPIMAALRSGIHTAIGMSPYSALSLYKLLKEVDALADGEIVAIEPSVKQKLLRSKIKENVEKAHQTYAKYYNTRARSRNFHKGEEVLHRNITPSNAAERRNKKFLKQFINCKIRKQVGSNIYELDDYIGNLIGCYHSKNIIKKDK